MTHMLTRSRSKGCNRQLTKKGADTYRIHVLNIEIHVEMSRNPFPIRNPRGFSNCIMDFALICTWISIILWWISIFRWTQHEICLTHAAVKE